MCWIVQTVLPLKDPRGLSGHDPSIHYKMVTSSAEGRGRPTRTGEASSEGEGNREAVF